MTIPKKNDIVHKHMLNHITKFNAKNEKITCQEVIDSTTDLCKKLRIPKYGNFGPLEKVLCRKANEKQKMAMKDF